MRKIGQWGALLLLVSSAAHAEPSKLLQGTEVKVRLLEEVKSGKYQYGHQLRFEVIEEIKDPGGRVLVAKGARAFGIFGRSGKTVDNGRGTAGIELQRAYAVDGTVIPLQAQIGASGKSNRTAGAVATSMTPWGIGGRWFKGKKATIRKGTELIAQLLEDVTVDPDKPDPAGAPLPTEPEKSKKS